MTRRLAEKNWTDSPVSSLTSLSTSPSKVARIDGLNAAYSALSGNHNVAGRRTGGIALKSSSVVAIETPVEGATGAVVRPGFPASEITVTEVIWNLGREETAVLKNQAGVYLPSSQSLAQDPSLLFQERNLPNPICGKAIRNIQDGQAAIEEGLHRIRRVDVIHAPGSQNIGVRVDQF